MTTLDKVIIYINSMDPIAREVILMELNNLRATYSLYFENSEKFYEKHYHTTLMKMEDDFYDKLKKLTGLKIIPIWPRIYRELFGKHIPLC